MFANRSTGESAQLQEEEMTVHAVLSAGADSCALGADTLNELQWEQHQHD